MKNSIEEAIDILENPQNYDPEQLSEAIDSALFSLRLHAMLSSLDNGETINHKGVEFARYHSCSERYQSFDVFCIGIKWNEESES